MTFFGTVAGSLWVAHPEHVGLIVLCALVPGAVLTFLVGYIVELQLEVPRGRVRFLTPAEAERLADHERAADEEDEDEEEEPARPRRRRLRPSGG
jgi:hypothetical protein